ncbi:hypothetical protein [Burkholderia sp. MSMB1498]|uniref:hypothetical protein n=1 Tax=Burkholderia sp. MSMB1498 TaxID=1637842 RepID=UPI0012E38A83|nr:hypothetical protein [Burkholderia sp. MSMB1498]
MDDYDKFLTTFDEEAVPALNYATIEPNLFEPLVQQRLLESAADGGAEVERAPYAQGQKQIAIDELALGALDFFQKKQSDWSEWFQEKLCEGGVDETKVDAYIYAFSSLWIDGAKRRQTSKEMQSIKASIKQHDDFFHKSQAGRYVFHSDVDGADPLLTPWEMQCVFDANSTMLEICIAEYLQVYHGPRAGSINSTYVRRGVYMPTQPISPMTELNYLNSYSLAVTLPEVFAQTYSQKHKDKGIPTIFSAPVPAVQCRTAAFAPFIKGMDLSQLEMVVAPPIEPMELVFHGVHGSQVQIAEYSYG